MNTTKTITFYYILISFLEKKDETRPHLQQLPTLFAWMYDPAVMINEISK